MIITSDIFICEFCGEFSAFLPVTTCDDMFHFRAIDRTVTEDLLRMSVIQGEEVVLSSAHRLMEDSMEEAMMVGDSMSEVWQGSQQNILALSILLCFALITNLSAAPVILFRRTR